MGLASSCFLLSCSSSSISHASPYVKLIFWGGSTQQLLPHPHIAADILFNNPDMMICHADSFFIGRPLPSISLHQILAPGHTYLILPIDSFPCNNLTTSALAALSSSKQKPVNSLAGQYCPFQYIKTGGEDGRLLIKVVPEFIESIVCAAQVNNKSCEDVKNDDDKMSSALCSTPELRKQYEQLVGYRERPWSPKLETITEKNKKTRASPVRLLARVVVN